MGGVLHSILQLSTAPYNFTVAGKHSESLIVIHSFIQNHLSSTYCVPGSETSPKDDLKAPGPCSYRACALYTRATRRHNLFHEAQLLSGQWWWSTDELGPQRRGQGCTCPRTCGRNGTTVVPYGVTADVLVPSPPACWLSQPACQKAKGS